MSEPRFSRHALVQLCRRRITIGAVVLALRHGHFEIDGHPKRHRVRVLPSTVASCPLLKPWHGLVVVVARDGSVVSAWMDRPGRRAA